MYAILTSDTDRFITAVADEQQAQTFVEQYNRVAPNYDADVYALPTTLHEPTPNPLHYMDTEALRDARSNLYDNASAIVIEEIDDEIARREGEQPAPPRLYSLGEAAFAIAGKNATSGTIHTADCPSAEGCFPPKSWPAFHGFARREGVRFCTECDARDEWQRWESFLG